MSLKMKTNMIGRRAIVATALFGLGGFALAQSTPSKPQVPPTAAQLRKMTVTGQAEVDLKLSEERNLRAKAMREAAQSYGARSGLLRRTYEISLSVEKIAHQLDATFNFAPLMLTDFQNGEAADKRARLVVPPIIVESGRTFNQQDENLIRQRDKILRIEQNAYFASVPPNWRKYMQRDLGESVAALPHASLLPKTPEERVNWDKWVDEGFAAGMSQADQINEMDTARLIRDYEGMVRYHELVEQKIVSLPFVATRNDGVTGDGNQININDVTLRITVKPSFDKDSTRWRAVESSDN